MAIALRLPASLAAWPRSRLIAVGAGVFVTLAAAAGGITYALWPAKPAEAVADGAAPDKKAGAKSAKAAKAAKSASGAAGGKVAAAEAASAADGHKEAATADAHAPPAAADTPKVAAAPVPDDPVPVPAKAAVATAGKDAAVAAHGSAAPAAHGAPAPEAAVAAAIKQAAARHAAAQEPPAGKAAPADTHAAPKAHAPAPEPATPARPVRSAAAAADPLETLKRRLGEKLGAQTGEQGEVVRISTRPTAAAAHGAAPGKPHGKSAKGGHAAGAHAPHWSYDGTGGPDEWGKLKAEFIACAVGKRQSPIDIREGVKVALDPVQFDYQPTTFRVVDNGHTVQVNVQPGSSIEAMGQRYELQQFHFHRPSEERIDGRRFDMVAHLVHKSPEGRLAVVAVLLERGAAQPLLERVWANLPLEKGDEVRAKGTIDLTQLLPADRGYYTYMGSLTTPPCSEGVLWMVMKQPVQLSPDQIGVFSRLYPMNARPVQQAADRLIKESN